nr:MAG TPA: hypothetical protein [Caudoviricetes sp.]
MNRNLKDSLGFLVIFVHVEFQRCSTVFDEYLKEICKSFTLRVRLSALTMIDLVMAFGANAPSADT